jgi:ribosomal protein S18 acetylase RimI-like enzyme
MVLRPATDADLPELLGLNASTQELHAREVPTHFKMPSADAGCAEMLRKMLAEPTACLVVAEEGEAVIGYFFAQEVAREESWVRPALRHFILEHIAVNSPFRRRGIGQALIERFFDEAKLRGIAQAGLSCWSFNGEANRFFRRHGFTELHVRMERNLG